MTETTPAVLKTSVQQLRDTAATAAPATAPAIRAFICRGQKFLKIGDQPRSLPQFCIYIYINMFSISISGYSSENH